MKKLLVITRTFAPSATIGAQRPLRLVRRIADFGWEPYVLTAPPKCFAFIDNTLGTDVKDKVKIQTVPCWSLWYHSKWWRQVRPSFLRIIAMVVRAIAKATFPVVPLDPSFPWAIAATRKGIQMVRENGIDLIWSTAPDVSALYLAKRIHNKTGVPFIADFRDVMLPPQKSRFSKEYINLKLEEKILRAASGISYTSPSQQLLLEQKFPFVKDKPGRLIYNWFEEEEIPNLARKIKDRITILHGGQLYGGIRDLNGFFRALAELNQNPHQESKRVRYFQYGQESKKYVSQLIKKFGLDDFIYFEPSLGRSAFLSACCRADILLLVVGHDTGAKHHSGAIPAKVFDYFMACRPILVLGPKRCNVGELVEKINRGIFVQDNSFTNIIWAIKKLLNGDGKDKKLDLSIDAIKEFEATRVVEKLSGYFQEVYNLSKR